MLRIRGHENMSAPPHWTRFLRLVAPQLSMTIPYYAVLQGVEKKNPRRVLPVLHCTRLVLMQMNINLLRTNAYHHWKQGDPGRKLPPDFSMENVIIPILFP